MELRATRITIAGGHDAGTAWTRTADLREPFLFPRISLLANRRVRVRGLSLDGRRIQQTVRFGPAVADAPTRGTFDADALGRAFQRSAAEILGSL